MSGVCNCSHGIDADKHSAYILINSFLFRNEKETK